METSTRGGRWLVSGVLGLAVLGAAGCGGPGASPSTSEQVGPAVVLNAPADSGLSKPPASKSTSKAAGAGAAGAAGTAVSAVSPDGATKQVPAAKPKPAKDSPNSAPTARTAKTPNTPPSANTP